ncbi:putative bifunctional diguanylate cyclase/phosphodiesterase [Sphingomonas hylomeconis]|uniref:Bifunctional diguanylate cyclase/phosphodiesterase n=1 Tax=Sphingomonas hylomeconis TaxID=1395958 RepID=A0ABV7T0K2_9SPHN|nr:sensor domain-containing phosphodiesterase [Sphingomonas hylomeconis]
MEFEVVASFFEYDRTRETERLAAIADYGLVGSSSDPEFDHIVELAASLFDVPTSLISIVEQDRQFFAARIGLEADATPRDMSFCAHTLDLDGAMVVPDASLDPRFAQNPLVLGPPYIRFYAGAPLTVASGHTLGTLCIISPEPRHLDAHHVRQLEGLAQVLVDRLELRRSDFQHQINERRLAQLAHVDQLTGLHNRTRFHELASGLIATTPISTVLLFDLDGFKDVNDVLGHATGDSLLAAVGDRLRSEAKDDYLLARLGGDEFALLIPGIGDPREAHRIAIDLRNAFRRIFIIDGEELQLDTSVGIAVSPHHGRTIEALLIAADLALYRAKSQGGGSVGFFEPHLRHTVETRQRLQGELRRAFEGGDFELLYQPQIDLVEQRIVGAEALLRWNHRDHGQLAPAQFLEVLERMPLAAAIGTWVLRTAIAQSAKWYERGMPIKVGVNLFPAQFKSGNLAERIANKLHDYKLPADLIEIELTETVAIKNSNMVISSLHSLRRIGVGIALDDFGTGYASLSLLKELPANRLKIDKSFVQNMEPGGSDAIIVDAIIRMGDSFKLDIIAEGVETVDQQERLIQAGCRAAQGYLYGKPMPAEQLTQLIQNWQFPQKLCAA